MKKILNRMAMGVVCVAAIAAVAYATVTYVQAFKVGGTYVWILQNDGATLQTGAEKFGASVTGSANTLPTTTTGSAFSTWVPVYNVGSAVTKGDVLIASNTATNTGVCNVIVAPATSGLTTVVGVAAEAIAGTTVGWMVPRGGNYVVVHTTGTVNIGDVLVTTITASGYATGSSAPVTGSDFGTAMSAGTSAGGSVVAILH